MIKYYFIILLLLVSTVSSNYGHDFFNQSNVLNFYQIMSFFDINTTSNKGDGIFCGTITNKMLNLSCGDIARYTYPINLSDYSNKKTILSFIFNKSTNILATEIMEINLRNQSNIRACGLHFDDEDTKIISYWGSSAYNTLPNILINNTGLNNSLFLIGYNHSNGICEYKIINSTNQVLTHINISSGSVLNTNESLIIETYSTSSASHYLIDNVMLYSLNGSQDINIIRFALNNIIFNNPVLDVEQKIIHQLSNNFSFQSVKFIFNGTQYNTTETYFNNNINTSSIIGFHPQKNNYNDLSFYFNYTDIFNISYISINNLSSYQLNVSDCGTGSNSLKFSFFSEDSTGTAITSQASTTITYWFNNRTINKNHSSTRTGANTYTYCISPTNTNYYADVVMFYNSSGYSTHRYYLWNQSLNNSQQNISSYLILTNDSTTSILRLTTRNTNYNILPNVLGQLQRYYPGENVWRTVQMYQSGEFGLQIYDIREDSVDYRFRQISYPNNLLKETNPGSFSCNLQLCELTVLLDPTIVGGGSGIIDVLTNYDNVTNNLTINWSHQQGLESTVRAIAVLSTQSGYKTICDTTQTGSSGIIMCNTSGYTGTVKLTVRATPNDNELTRWYELVTGKLSSILGASDSAFWTLGIAITVGMIGAFSPAGGIIALLGGLVFSYMIGSLTFFGIGTLSLICVMGIIIGVILKN